MIIWLIKQVFKENYMQHYTTYTTCVFETSMLTCYIQERRSCLFCRVITTNKMFLHTCMFGQANKCYITLKTKLAQAVKHRNVELQETN